MIYPAFKIEHGLKIKVKKEALDRFINNQELKKDFQMNVKRVDRWWWSVYFKTIK